MKKSRYFVYSGFFLMAINNNKDPINTEIEIILNNVTGSSLILMSGDRTMLKVNSSIPTPNISRFERCGPSARAYVLNNAYMG